MYLLTEMPVLHLNVNAFKHFGRLPRVSFIPLAFQLRLIVALLTIFEPEFNSQQGSPWHLTYLCRNLPKTHPLPQFVVVFLNID